MQCSRQWVKDPPDPYRQTSSHSQIICLNCVRKLEHLKNVGQELDVLCTDVNWAAIQSGKYAMGMFWCNLLCNCDWFQNNCTLLPCPLKTTAAWQQKSVSNVKLLFAKTIVTWNLYTTSHEYDESGYDIFRANWTYNITFFFNKDHKRLTYYMLSVDVNIFQIFKCIGIWKNLKWKNFWNECRHHLFSVYMKQTIKTKSIIFLVYELYHFNENSDVTQHC